jgi:predicted metal-dependent HD superfamily phosphohydrolase
MRERFLALARRHGADEETADRWWRELESRYAEPHRHYHTLAHIEHMLDLLPHADETVQAAVWFHDAIYGAGNDEAQSAALARRALGELRFPPDAIDAVESLILATTTHDRDDVPAAHRAFLDADLAILGSDEERYRVYVDGVRQEYAYVPEALFRDARGAILRRFLARPFLYGTDEFRERFERKARENIERELRGAGVPPATDGHPVRR